jgi:hypothetical protein
MSANRPTLDQPVVVSKFWKNRRRDESVHVTLSEYQGHSLINIRVYSTGSDGIDRPTTKGVAMAICKLPALAQAISAAKTKALELGLLDDKDEGST